jgi:hypothetical protein
MAITNTKKNNAIKVIQDLNLDRMTEIGIINLLESDVTANKTAREIADDIFNKLEKENLGNITMAAGSNLMVDKQTLNIMRQQIEKELS